MNKMPAWKRILMPKVPVTRERRLVVGDSKQRLLRLEAEVRRLRETLQFYACGADGFDRGKRAERALRRVSGI